MGLIEILASLVGPAIARIILRKWLGDPDVAEEVTASIVDIVKGKTGDILAQKRAGRQFEAIGEKVALNLIPVFELDGANLDESQRVSIALAVSDTLNQAKITPDLLLKKDLEPVQLGNYLLESYPQAKSDFSEQEYELYRRIISETSENIVDIASELPAFTERTFTEILRRENELINVTNEVLREVIKIRKATRQVNPKKEAAIFESEYRRATTRKLDKLELYGADVSSASRRHRLSVAYITLSVAKKLSIKDSFLSKIGISAKVESEKSQNILPVDEALQGEHRVLIRGLAGSGKTTLLKWIAVCAASRTFKEPLSEWNDKIPFFVRLRQFADLGLPQPEDFPQLVAPSISDTMPKGWVHWLMREGRAILLVDGIDEVPTFKRDEVRDWLSELTEAFSKSYFIVTSRPAAVEEGWISEKGYIDAELQPMELSDVYRFINHWHQAVYQEVQDVQQQEALEPLADHLKATIRYNRTLAYMATSPLLCAMLCALHRDRNRQIPSDRIEMYESCCYMLIERRDIERQIEIADYPKLNYREKRLILEDLAYWMLRNGLSMVKNDRVVARIQYKLENMPNVSQDTSGTNVLKFFIERSGLIREPLVGSVDFTHRTFYEFLAAKAAIDAGDIGVLVKNAHDYQWREVIILAAGVTTTRLREELIMALIQRSDSDEDERYKLHLLAVACLESSIELGSEIKREVETRLSNLIPPTSNAEAKDLSSAGDLSVTKLVPYLQQSGKHTSSVIAACIRTLGLVGSDLALEALENYNQVTDEPLLVELLKAWDFFDRERYGLRVLSRVHTVNLGKPSSLKRVSYLKNLTSLFAADCSSIENLDPLKGLVSLQSLKLNHSYKVRDLKPLEGLFNLTKLDLFGCKSTSFRSVSKLSNLVSLRLADFEYSKNLSPLANLKNLRDLDLSACRMITDVRPLSKLTNLVFLDLSGCTGITDIQPLRSLVNLRKIRLKFIENQVKVPLELKRYIVVD